MPESGIEGDISAVAAAAGAEIKGLAANLVSTIRSFLPTAKPSSPVQAAGKKGAKVKALEAAEAARRREEEKAVEKVRQKHEAERLRQERIKAKAAAEAEELRKREEARIKREEEAAQRRKDKEEAEKREREEKARRLEDAKQRRKREEAAAATAAARAGAGSSRPGHQVATSTSNANSLAEAKQRLAKIQQQAALMVQKTSGKPATTATTAIATSSQQPSRLPAPSTSAYAPAQPSTAPSEPAHQEPQSYEISPYKSDFESDDDVPKKPVPDWARGKALMAQLVEQTYIDPDEVFQHHVKTCTLDEVFAHKEGKGGRQDFSRRSSSGNWFEDRVTWKEELAYKKAMGYI